MPILFRSDAVKAVLLLGILVCFKPIPAAWAQSPPILPNSSLTPGATLPVTKDDICVPGYTQKVRNVPADVKAQVYAEYGILHHARGEYEVDHLISLELGGSNSIKNLWPESYKTKPWNAHVKDALENEMHRQVCNGTLPLATAQHDIATDWIAAYKKYFHTNTALAVRGNDGSRRAKPRRGLFGFHLPGTPPIATTAASPGSDANAAPASNASQVWVNTRSGKYFQHGSRYYGKTKEGEYMTESQAKARGYVAAQSD